MPVTMGSPRFRTMDLGAIRIHDATFAPRDVLPLHAHERTILAVMLAGGFDVTFPTRQFDCLAGTAFIEPAGDVHANRMSQRGARVMVLELDAHAVPNDRRRGGFFDEPSAARRHDLLGLSLALARELGAGQGATPLAAESLAWELIDAVRPARTPHGGRRWVETVRDVLHAHLDRPLRVADLAKQVGVHRVHLGRVFRERFGQSLGDYHRRIRIEWAARELLLGHASVTDVAQRAGFADQAHFTRFFKRIMGATPVAWSRRQKLQSF